MQDSFTAKMGRAVGWVIVTIASFVLGIGAAFLPLSYLPGPLHTDYVNGRWVDLAAILYLIAVLTWRLSPINQNIRLTAAVAGKFIWLTVTAFLLAFGPIGLVVWFNGWNSRPSEFREVVIARVQRTTVRPAVTSIEHYIASDVRTGLTIDLAATADRKRTFRVGDCVRVSVRSGRLGLNWIDGAQVHPCP